MNKKLNSKLFEIKNSSKFIDNNKKKQSFYLHEHIQQRNQSSISINHTSNDFINSSIEQNKESILNFHTIRQLSYENQSIEHNQLQQQQHTDRHHSIMIRCSCLTTIIRNLSFIEENEYLANDRCLLDILERILRCHHQNMHQIFDYQCKNYISTCSYCSDIVNVDDIQFELSIDANLKV